MHGARFTGSLTSTLNSKIAINLEAIYALPDCSSVRLDLQSKYER